VHHAKVVEPSFDEGQFTKVIPLTHAADEGLGGTPDTLNVNQVQLFQVVGNFAPEHVTDMFDSVLVQSVALYCEIVQLLLVAKPFTDLGQLVSVKAVVVEVKFVNEVGVIHQGVLHAFRVASV